MCLTVRWWRHVRQDKAAVDDWLMSRWAWRWCLMNLPAVGGFLNSRCWAGNLLAMFWIGRTVLALHGSDLGETHVASGCTLAKQFAETLNCSLPRFLGIFDAAALLPGAFFAYLGGALCRQRVLAWNRQKLALLFPVRTRGLLPWAISHPARKAKRSWVNTWCCGLSGQCKLWLCLYVDLLAGLMARPLSFLVYDDAWSALGITAFASPTRRPGLCRCSHLAGTASGLAGIMIGGGCRTEHSLAVLC